MNIYTWYAKLSPQDRDFQDLVLIANPDLEAG